MTSRTGLESRFLGRFIQRELPNRTEIDNVDSARGLVDKFRTSVAVIETQKKNIDEMFNLASDLVSKVDIFQQKSGERQVRNVMTPTEEIQESYGMKLGYIKMCLSFFNAGMLHFMEEGISLSLDLNQSRNVVGEIAHQDQSVPILGEIIVPDLDNLNSNAPIADTRNEPAMDLTDDDTRSTRGESLQKPEKKKTSARKARN